jgi:hypothetical protein
MKLPVFTAIAVFFTSFAMSQVSSVPLLSPGTTLPIQFERSVDTNHVHVGDASGPDRLSI